MRGTATLGDLVQRQPEDEHLIWVACADCGRSLGRHMAYVSDESGVTLDWWMPGEVGHYRAGHDGRQTRPELRSRNMRGKRTGPGIYFLERDGNRYFTRRCHCGSVDRDPPKRRVEKVGELPVRTDADGKTWVDF